MTQMLRQADVLHVHDASTAEAIAARYGRRDGVAIVPHGHYLTSYPEHDRPRGGPRPAGLARGRVCVRLPGVDAAVQRAGGAAARVPGLA